MHIIKVWFTNQNRKAKQYNSKIGKYGDRQFTKEEN